MSEIFDDKQRTILGHVLDIKLKVFNTLESKARGDDLNEFKADAIIKAGESIEKSIFGVKKLEQNEAKNGQQQSMNDNIAHFLEEIRQRDIRQRQVPMTMQGEIPEYKPRQLVLNDGEATVGQDDVTLNSFREQHGLD